MTSALISAVLALSPTPLCAQVPSSSDQAREAQGRDYWTDPTTKLTWAAKDNGKDISWKAASKYCRKSRLAGYSDWRMPDLGELQGLYDEKLESRGMAGDRQHYRPSTWHIKGNIFLTGIQWTILRRVDDRGKPVSYVYYFDFNDGVADNDPIGWPYGYVDQRVLCVRGPEANPVHVTKESGPIKIEDHY